MEGSVEVPDEHLARLGPRGHDPGLLWHHAQPVHGTVVGHRDMVKFGVVVQVLKNILEFQCPGMLTESQFQSTEEDF